MKVAANSTKKRLRGDDVEISCSRNGSLEIFSNIFEFWKEVKDNLSLCLLTALCERSGLPPPPSFLLLPTELKMRILEMLPAAALASLGCVCSELRFLASSNDLWKERYKQEFGLREGNQGSEYGWKSAFAREWVRRKQREDGLQDHALKSRDHSCALAIATIFGTWIWQHRRRLRSFAYLTWKIWRRHRPRWFRGRILEW
ncbi:hypothetical protein O6H91_01G028900 [Diphasiastrum complanatum]|uniref:Uncharacterized protein n=1 Tax=Diphasiastrum complanatum TaxID=34168 RepID=A0ACC2EPD1_DIPCM|nr:hypothetical protein O6H91_01G028900 [Diphasiastrum complanatum]